MRGERKAKSGPSGGEGPDGTTAAVINRDLLEAVRRREPEALGRFFELTFDRVFGLALRLLGERSAAEDIVQEVFLRVHRAADRLDPEKDPLPWLRRIATNLCRDHWRSFGSKVAARSIPIDGTPGIAEKLADETESADARALADERERLVQKAIDELPGPLRETVVLRDYEGLEHEEIARLVGASGAAVRKRYSRALASLGEKLRERLL